MRNLYGSGAGGDRGCTNPLDTQKVPANRHPHNIGNRVDGTHFMKMDFLKRCPVNFGLRFP